jgi:hypothetical protein
VTIPLATNHYRKSSLRYWTTAIRHILHRPKLAWGRMRQGYNYADVWGFDTYLARVIAGGLRELAESPHATPMMGSGYYPADINVFTGISEEIQTRVETAWREDLREAARKLDMYVEDEWANHELGKEAMMWVAENFGSLWD